MTRIETHERARKTALAPDLRRLDDRAARAWTERMAVRTLDGPRYAVDAESGATYVVDVAAGTCTCPDHRIRGERCKHLRRVAIEITGRRVPPPGHARARCDACGTETVVPERADPPDLCPNCALEPGDVAFDRETGDRLVVRAVTDRRADAVRIPETGGTVADHPTNAGYPDDDLVVEAVYLAALRRAGRAGEEPRRYSFPLSRLARTDDAALV
jgi:hypothetical protein